MNAFKVSFSAICQAHKFIKREGIFRLFKVPLLLSVIYFPIMVVACFLTASVIVDFILGYFTLLSGAGEWLEWLLEIVFFLFVGFLGVISYRGVVLVFYSFFLDGIAEKVELEITGKKIDCERPKVQVLKRVVIVLLFIILGTIVLVLVNLFANVIPVMGAPLAFLIIFPVEMFITGTGFIDPYFDRNGLNGMDSFRLMRKNFLLIAVFSALSSLILIIPVVGWFVGPTYSVVAGMIIAIGIHHDNQPKRVDKMHENLEQGTDGTIVTDAGNDLNQLQLTWI